LPNKETKIYEQAFNSLIEVYKSKSKFPVHFQPKMFIVDFEQSIRRTTYKAVLTVWPNIINYVVADFTSLNHGGEKSKI